MLLFFLCSPASLAIELHSDTEIATAGYYQLTWDADKQAAIFQVQEATTPDFVETKALYRGPDKATMVTGRSDGHYYYRARLIDAQGSAGSWSATTEVQVAHHPLSRAFAFFTVGAIVFIAIFLAIVMGNKVHHIKE